MKRIAINTLGCRTNQLESSIISDEFKNNGWEIVKFDEVADIYIINTCTVTGKSDSTSRYMVRQAKRKNPKSKIIVTGCYAQTSADEVSQFEEVDLVIGNVEKQNIYEILVKNGVLEQESRKVFVSDIMEQDTFKDKVVTSASGRTRANIKIQDGCNFRCSYCIIPYARGKSRSNSLENVINQVKEITEKGFKEIVLSGIHLGQWGLDFTPKSTLAKLIQEIEKIETLERFRISSIDPQEFDYELIETLVNSKKFCRHLHISLQSGNNEILKQMRRRYSVEFYSELIEKLTSSINDLAIGSDIIVGFPGETDEHFQDTCKNLESLPISYIHVFTYSKRKGTPAAEMKNQVKDFTKKERNTILTEIAKNKNLDFRNSLLGKDFGMLVEFSRDRKTGLLKGVTDNFIPVLAEGDDNLMNKLVKVRITKVTPDQTIGELIL